MLAPTLRDPRREIWVCGDESGTFTATERPEDRYFLIVTVGVEGDSLRTALDDLDRELRPLLGDPRQGLFHAAYDTPLTRDRVFALLKSHNLAIDVSIVDKATTPDELTGRLGYRLYTLLWYHHLIHTLPGLLHPANKVSLVVAELGDYSRKEAFRNAVAQATGVAYAPLLERALAAVGYTWANDAHHQMPALRLALGDARTDRLLQVADYCAWAIQRKLSRNDDRGYGDIRHLIRSQRNLTINKRASAHDPAVALPVGLVAVAGLTGLTHDYAVSSTYHIGPSDSFQALLALQEAVQVGVTQRAVEYVEAIRPSDMWQDKKRFQGFLNAVGLLVDEVMAYPDIALRATATLAKVARHALVTHGRDLLPRALLSAALYNHGLTCGRLGMDDDALRTYNEVIEQLDDDRVPIIDVQIAKALVNKANILRRRGENPTAFNLYCQAIELCLGAGADMALFDEPFTKAVGSIISLETVDKQRAEAIYRRVMVSGHTDAAPRAAQRLGLLLRDRADVSEAEEAFRRAVDAGHCDVSPYAANNLAWLLRGQGRISEAETAYQQALDSGHPTAAPEAALSLGWLRFARGDDARAEEMLRRALNHPNTAPEAGFHLAQVFARQKRLGEAETALRRAIAAGHPRITGRAHGLLGWVLYEMGDRVAAEQAYREAIAANDPETAPLALADLGALLHDRGDHCGAEAALLAAVSSGNADAINRASSYLDAIHREP